METKKFNPSERLIQLKGKDYLEVKWRLVWFREEKPNWNIETTCIEADDKHAIFTCKIQDESGAQKSSGHGSESTKDFGDYIEKAETKAVGRALAMLGYGTQFAPDLEEGDRIVDAPVERKRAPKQQQGNVPPPPTPQEFANQVNGLVCIDCGAAITEKVAKYSEEVYGIKHACVKCQKHHPKVK